MTILSVTKLLKEYIAWEVPEIFVLKEFYTGIKKRINLFDFDAGIPGPRRGSDQSLRTETEDPHHPAKGSGTPRQLHLLSHLLPQHLCRPQPRRPSNSGLRHRLHHHHLLRRLNHTHPRPLLKGASDPPSLL